MSEKGGTTPPESDQLIVHRKLFEERQPSGAENPEIDLAEIVADLEGKDATNIASLYETIDHVVEHLYSNPPPIEAQAQLEFTYEGYRIELSQDGRATFMKITE